MNRKSGDSTRKTAQGEINPPLHELVQFRREFNSMCRVGDRTQRCQVARLHPHKLQHIDHACLDALHDWQKQQEKFGSSMVVEWEDLVARYGGPAPSQSILTK